MTGGGWQGTPLTPIGGVIGPHRAHTALSMSNTDPGVRCSCGRVFGPADADVAATHFGGSVIRDRDGVPVGIRLPAVRYPLVGPVASDTGVSGATAPTGRA